MGFPLLIAMGFFASAVGLLHVSDGRRGSGVFLSLAGLLLLGIANGVPLPLAGSGANPWTWLLAALALGVVVFGLVQGRAERPARAEGPIEAAST